jgi:hypothetical protein
LPKQAARLFSFVVPEAGRYKWEFHPQTGYAGLLKQENDKSRLQVQVGFGTVL